MTPAQVQQTSFEIQAFLFVATAQVSEPIAKVFFVRLMTEFVEEVLVGGVHVWTAHP